MNPALKSAIKSLNHLQREQKLNIYVSIRIEEWFGYK